MPEKERDTTMLETKEIITWDQFADAVDKFANDLEIVRHIDDPIKTPFEAPDPGKYFLTISRRLIDMGQQEFIAQLQAGPIVLATMCMDKRGAEGTYQALLTEAGQKYPGAKVIFLSMGGGAAQEEKVIRPEGIMSNYNRRVALRTIINYIRQNTKELVGELHSVHNGQCGALKFSHNDVPVADRCQVPVCSLPEGKVALDTAHRTVIDSDELQHPIEFFLAHFDFARGDNDIAHAGFVKLLTEEQVEEASQ